MEDILRSRTANRRARGAAARGAGAAEATVPLVGRITGMVDCQWADPATEACERDSVPLGRKYALASGFMEITYDTGAKVILQGPALMRSNRPAAASSRWAS